MKKTISIVTPCFNEEENVELCYQTIRDIFAKHLPDYEREHIFCDNASTDRTLEILKKLATDDSSVKVIVNSRNFGPLRNTYNGIMASTGDATVLFMPADMQDPPELIPEFTKLWEQGYEVIYGIRAGRSDPPLMSAIINWLTGK
jgi:glycosyltransferase involved in cell wall biosynthesis